jgi:peroxiredoxin
MPMFERLHRELSAQGLAVVGINAREGTATIRAYARELGLTFPLILDPKGATNAAYGVIGLPTTFLIGRDGRPVALAVGPREWASKPARAIIQALLAEPAALKGTR